LVCAIQFTLGTACLTMSISNFLAMFFQQLLSLALVSLTIRITCFLLLIGMQERPGVNTHSIFQSNMCIAACNSLSCPSVGIHRTLLLRSSSVLLPGNTVSANTRVFQRGLLFLFIHWFNEGYCVDRHQGYSSV
jgi:hypothetical protein